MLILASILPDPNAFQSIGWILLALAALCAAANQIDAFLDRRKTKPEQPPNGELQKSVEHQQQSIEQLRCDFEKQATFTAQEIRNIFQKLGGVERGVEERLTKRLESMASQDKESRGKMHNEISQLQMDVSALKTSTDHINQNVILLGTKFDRLLERESERR